MLYRVILILKAILLVASVASAQEWKITEVEHVVPQPLTKPWKITEVEHVVPQPLPKPETQPKPLPNPVDPEGVTPPHRLLVAFTASWCQPCRSNEPALEALSRTGVEVRRIDIDERPDDKARYGIDLVPTYLVYLGDKQVARVTGVQSVDQFERLFAGPQLSSPRMLPGVESNRPATTQGFTPTRVRHGKGGRRCSGCG